jgi:nucleoside-diphosphate-sugar epimerase
MLALVTGGHGFIGSHLCERLLAEGHQVRVLARAHSDLSRLSGLKVAVFPGDLLEPLELSGALRGVHWVFHLAGALKGFKEADLMAVNRDGTRRLTEACVAQAPELRRFLLVSSLAAAGPSPGGTVPLAEEPPPHPLTWYGHSKWAAEQEVVASGLPCIILRPPVVFGPGDRDVLSVFRMARWGLVPIPGHWDRHYSLIYAPDLAEGLLRAAEAPVPSGQIIPLVSPEAVTWADLGRRMAHTLGRRGQDLHIPEGLLRLGGRLADATARLRGRPGIFSSQKVVEMLAPAWVASPEKAKRLLGWVASTPLDEALARTAHWYRDHGWL